MPSTEVLLDRAAPTPYSAEIGVTGAAAGLAMAAVP